MTKSRCILKNCNYRKECTCKKNPFEGNTICNGYRYYIHQDIIRKKGTQFESPFSDIEIRNISYEELEEMYESGKTKRELIIQMFFFDGEKVPAIADQLYCSVQYVYGVIKECKKSLLMTSKASNKKLIKKVNQPKIIKKK